MATAPYILIIVTVILLIYSRFQIASLDQVIRHNNSTIETLWSKNQELTNELNAHKSTSTVDCRSEEGITTGCIDSIIAIARIAAKRDLTPEPVQEALKDLRHDEDLQSLLIVKANV